MRLTRWITVLTFLALTGCADAEERELQRGIAFLDALHPPVGMVVCEDEPGWDAYRARGGLCWQGRVPPPMVAGALRSQIPGSVASCGRSRTIVRTVKGRKRDSLLGCVVNGEAAGMKVRLLVADADGPTQVGGGVGEEGAFQTGKLPARATPVAVP